MYLMRVPTTVGVAVRCCSNLTLNSMRTVDGLASIGQRQTLQWQKRMMSVMA